MPSVHLKMFTKRHLQGKLCRFKETNTSWSLKITSTSFWNISIGFLGFKTFARTPSWPFNKGSRSQSHDAGVWRLRFSGVWPFLPEHSGPRIRWVGKFRRSRWTTSLAPCGPQDLEDLAETLSDLHDALRPWPGILGILPSCLFLSEGYSIFPMNPWNPWNPEPRSLDLGCERSKRVEMLMEPHWPLMLQHYRPTCRTPIFRYRTNAWRVRWWRLEETRHRDIK